MKSLISVIGIVVLGLAIFLSGCGKDEESGSTSINVPINFSPAMATGDYQANVTITATDMPTITATYDITIKPGSSKTYDITINNIPIGANRNVKVEIIKDGKVLFEGSGIVNLSSTAGASLPIKVEPVGHKLVADFTILTSANPNIPNLQNGHVAVDASNSYDTHYDIEVSWDWGDGEKTDFSPVLTAEHDYSHDGEYAITLTVENITSNSGPAVSKHFDTIQQIVKVETYVDLDITFCRDVQDWKPVDVTKTFNSSDTTSWTFLNIRGVPADTKYVIIWTWYDPNSSWYADSNLEITEPGNRLAKAGIYISGYRAGTLLGEWTVIVHVEVYVNGNSIGYYEESDNFTIE